MAYVPSTRTSKALPAKGVEAETKRAASRLLTALSPRDGLFLTCTSRALTSSWCAYQSLILDGSERPRPRVRGFASAIENRVGSWKGLGLGERDALGVELSKVAAADGVVLVFVAGGALLAHLLFCCFGFGPIWLLGID